MLIIIHLKPQGKSRGTHVRPQVLPGVQLGGLHGTCTVLHDDDCFLRRERARIEASDFGFLAPNLLTATFARGRGVGEGACSLTVFLLQY